MSLLSGTPAITERINRIKEIYGREVLSQRTRVVRLLGRKCEPQLMYTFLGFELKLSRKRITCPDMVTARYLMLFAEIGMDTVSIPYDPTQTARLLPELEGAFSRIKEWLLGQGYGKAQHQLAVRKVYQKIREGLKEAERRSL